MAKRRRNRGATHAPKATNTYAMQQHYFTYLHYRNLLENYCVTRHDWKNLPDSINERFLETELLYKGMAVIFKPWFSSELLGLGCSIWGQPNMYGEPVRVKAQGYNNFSYKVNLEKDGALIYDQQAHTNGFYTIEKYARELANFDQTIAINLGAQKTPVYISCPQEKVETFLQLSAMYQAGTPVFLGRDTAMMGSEITAITTNATYLIDKLFVDKAKCLAEFFSAVGIDNANQDKKERLVEAESSANDGQVEMGRLIGLTPRRRACKIINEIYADYLEEPVDCVFVHDNASANYNYLHNIPMQENVADGTVL